MQESRYRDTSNIQLTKEVEEKTIWEFRKYGRMKVDLEVKQGKYNESRDMPYEDLLPYKSSMDIESDVKTSGGGRTAPQERFTLQFKAEEEALLKQSIKVSELETIVTSAIGAAVAEARWGIKYKVENALNTHLVNGVPASMIEDVSDKTLRKFKRIAVINAAISFGYIDYEEQEAGASKSPVKKIAAVL